MVNRGAGALLALLLASTSPALAQTGNGVGSPFELAFWQSVAGSDDPALYEAYLQQYPAGTFSGLAKVKLIALRKAKPAAPEPPAPGPVLTAPVQPAPVPVPPAPLVAVAPAPVAARPAPLPPPVAVVPPAAPVVASARVLPSPPPAPPTPPAAAAKAADMSSDLALLAAMAKSQEAGGTTAGLAAAQGFALPERPALAAVAEFALPASFCSAEERNQFHDTRYRPVLAQAQAANDEAVAHMQKLQTIHEQYKAVHDFTPMNAIAVESGNYQQQVAIPAYERLAALVTQFASIVALPIRPCAVPGAAK